MSNVYERMRRESLVHKEGASFTWEQIAHVWQEQAEAMRSADVMEELTVSLLVRGSNMLQVSQLKKEMITS